MNFPQLHVGAGAQTGPLTIFPVWTDGPGNLGISTGRHAAVEVSELESGPQVGRLTVTNTGSRPALLLEGELLEGGLQHRVCAVDVVLAAGERRDIDTFCVEQGRWAGNTAHGRSARRAPMNVRAELRLQGVHTRQGRVWERVARYQGMNGVSSRTSSLVEHLTAGPADAARGIALATPLEGQRGIVIGLGGQPLMMEVFGTHTLFRRHYRQLLEAALLDAGLAAMMLPTSRVPAQGARDFAAQLATLAAGSGKAAPYRDHGGISTQSYSVDAPDCALSSTSVSWKNRAPQVVHLTAWNTQHAYVLAA